MGVVEPISDHGAPGRPLYAAPRLISATDKLDAFDSGKQPLDDYLRERALETEGKSARTYVVCSTAGPDAGNVVGYYTLATGSVPRKDMPGKIRHGLPNPAPVMVLGRLAVDRRHKGKRIGLGLLKEALLRTAEVSKIAGIRALLVHAIDDDALNFYMHAYSGFMVFPAGSRTLFLPVETIIAAL